MPKNLIRDLARKDQLDQAFDALNELMDVSGQTYYQNTVTSMVGSYYGLKTDRNKGVITDDFYYMRRSRLRNSLLSVLDELPDMADDAYDLKSLPKKQDYAALPVTEPLVAHDPGPAADDVLRVLIFTANTAGEVQLDLSDEYARIREMLDNENLNDRCQLRRIRLVTPEVIMDEILDFKPHIVHFSGHGVRQRDAGTGGGAQRGFGEEEETDGDGTAQGIELSNDGALVIHSGAHYGSFQIGADFLGSVFEYVKDEDVPARLVVFNACHSEAVAGGVAPHIKHIIATNNEIGDQAAISFSSTFYQRLIDKQAKPRSAFRAARIVTMAYQEPKERFLFYENGQQVKL